jgi:hypothetical protein
MKTLLLLILSISIGLSVNQYMPRLYQYKAPQVTTVALAPTPTPDVDKLVDTYSKKYGKTRYEQNRIKVALHFLLLKEQNYGGSNNCGDSGKACGPLQFHEPTYIAYRNIMIKKGFVMEIGSRLDMENAIETTAWAISDGREIAWGPIARGEIKL